MLKLIVFLTMTLMVAGCDKTSEPSAQAGIERKLIQGMHAEFYSASDAQNKWFEVAISVDQSKTFRMPVFFSQDGKLVKVTDEQAYEVFDAWLKERAKNIAAFGSIDEQTGLKGPFLALDLKRWQGK
jgi:hypothetical protein